ncbi:hypothetical protein [Falsiroseomonas tokyonensis]|uniref:hypothetical protein n=1 Tax=Falsiroseomonas tokyonensis TaxID=430521 RepID=UPI001C2076A5|nr:hypothetical protein [Falsiroseomonas tokyonensis]
MAFTRLPEAPPEKAARALPRAERPNGRRAQTARMARHASARREAKPAEPAPGV